MFDGYRSPGSLRSDGNGLISLRVSHPVKFGGTSHRIFWIWEWGDDPLAGPTSLVLKISAPNHVAVTMTIAELLDKDRVSITLQGK